MESPALTDHHIILQDVNLNFLWFQSFAELEAKERAMEGMRLALSEQEETQEQMEHVLEEKLSLIQELSSGKVEGGCHCVNKGRERLVSFVPICT